MGRKVRRWEAEIIKRGIEPGRRYLRRLLERMYVRGFDRDDEIFQAARAALDAIDRLWVMLHYRSCGGPNGIIDPELDGEPRPVLLAILH